MSSTALRRHEDHLFQKSLVKELPDKEETCRKKKQHNKGNKPARDSGLAESLEDRDSGFSLTDGYCDRRHHLYCAVNTSTTALTACLFVGSGNQTMHIH